MKQEDRWFRGSVVQTEDRMDDSLARNRLLETFDPILTWYAFFSCMWSTHSELGSRTAALQEKQERRKRLEQWAVKICHKKLLPHEINPV
ncbi:MAG: hypothetical protein CV090_08985 [Nitrospira sp. WS238]|nr:hypothetical protein [Nitrospira sp. WS238]